MMLGRFGYKNSLEEESLIFVDSKQFLLIQIADCAGYIVNKWQQLLGRKYLKPFEIDFLSICNNLSECVVDMKASQLVVKIRTGEVMEKIDQKLTGNKRELRSRKPR